MSGAAEHIGGPAHLTAAHDVSAFDCGIADLNDWLKQRALSNEESGHRALTLCARRVK